MKKDKKRVRPVNLKAWAVGKLAGVKCPSGYACWWSTPNTDVVVALGLASGRVGKETARKRLEDAYLAEQQTDKRVSKKPHPAASNAFLSSYEWRVLRMKILKRDGARCACCGATPRDGVVMHVDHIKPRRTHPEMALDPDNLQVLCEVCNHGKSNWDDTDWRESPLGQLDSDAHAHLKSMH